MSLFARWGGAESNRPGAVDGYADVVESGAGCSSAASVCRRPCSRSVVARQPSCTFGAARVDGDPLHLAGPGWRRTWLEAGVAVQVAQASGELDHIRLSPGADVDRPRRRRVGRGDQRRDYVVDVDVVAGLGPVAVDGRPFSSQQLAAEDRDHPRLPEWVLTRAVDVAETEGDRREAVEPLVEREVTLRGELALAVGRHRRERSALGQRQPLAFSLAVDRTPGRGEYEAGNGRRPHGLEHIGGSADIDRGVESGVGDRLADVDLGRQVEDRVRFRLADDGGDRAGVADVELDQFGTRAECPLEVPHPAGREVVDHGHGGVAGEQGVDQSRADEPSPASDQIPHSNAIVDARAGASANFVRTFGTGRSSNFGRSRLTYQAVYR